MARSVPSLSRTIEPVWLRWTQGAALVLAAAFVYWPALRGEWIWDDHLDLVDNRLLRSLGGLRDIWLHPTLLYDFYPLKHTVQWLQWQLWGNQSLGYHLTNLALHVLSAGLFWRVLRQLGVRAAWLGALLFTVHPLAVESVAWVVELKNTLSLPPLLLAVSAFLDFLDRDRPADRWRAVAWFLVSLLCKSGGIMLPVFLLVLLWWKRGRLSRGDARITAPFFAVSLALGLVTLWFQDARAIGHDAVSPGGWAERIALSGRTLAFYLSKAVWPANLQPTYPQWTVAPLAWESIFTWAVGAAIVVPCWIRRATWGRHALLGLAWFGLHLLPFSGLATASYMKFTWVMDHLTYVPLLGLFGLAAAAFDFAGERLSFAARPLMYTAAIVTCGAWAWTARAHAAHFQSEEVFWRHAIAHHPGSGLAHFNLALALKDRGDSAGVRAEYEAALQVQPNYAEAHHNLGILLRETGEVGPALAAFEAAIRAQPDFAEAHNSLGSLLRELGRPAEAKAQLDEALRLRPGYAAPHNNLSQFHFDAGRTDDAIREVGLALQLEPEFFEAHNNLGTYLARAGRLPAALAEFRQALNLQPQSPVLLYNIGNVLRDLHQLPEAITAFEGAVQLAPNFAQAHQQLAACLHESGREADATAHLQRAREINQSPAR